MARQVSQLMYVDVKTRIFTGYSLIQGEEIVADIFTKQVSKREALDEIV